MRKVVLVALLLLVVLTGCAKPELTTPISDSPVSPSPPVKQTDPQPPVNNYPELKDQFFVERAEVEFDENINTRTS